MAAPKKTQKRMPRRREEFEAYRGFKIGRAARHAYKLNFSPLCSALPVRSYADSPVAKRRYLQRFAKEMRRSELISAICL